MDQLSVVLPNWSNSRMAVLTLTSSWQHVDLMKVPTKILERMRAVSRLPSCAYSRHLVRIQ